MELQALVTAPPPTQGATPLTFMTPVFIDFETLVSKSVNLKCMTLRQYMAKSRITAIAVAFIEEEPEVFTAVEELAELAEFLTNLARDENHVFVAHNAAFDIRVLRFMLGVPQPQNVWCTLGRR